MKQKRTGWERERRVHFDEIAEEYDKIRWDYPDELFADALDYCEKSNASATCKKAIEIGAGTGKATKPFLDAGYNITAIEMGENMTRFLLNKYSAYKEFQVITSTFEEIELKDDSYDIIYAASAFHWVDAKIGCPKVFRLLKKGGAFVLFRSNWNSHDDEKLAKAIQEIYEKHYYSYYDINDRDDKPKKISLEILQRPSEIYKGFRFESMEQYGFEDVEMKVYDKSHTYDADDYIKLLDTFSDHRALPEENKQALYAQVKNTIEKHGGRITTHSTDNLYMGRKP